MLLSQIFNHVAEGCIDFVVLLQLFIHRFSAVSQVQNLSLLWGNILSQVSNLLVQNELEFFELLRLFLQGQDIPLSIMNGGVFDVDLRLFLDVLVVQLVDDLNLLFKRGISVIDLALESFDFSLNVSQLVLRDL